MTDLEIVQRARNSARAQRLKIEARRARRHTIADIKFGRFVSCSCAWRYDGPDTEAVWKSHKFDVGERTSH